jgi:hypothetical protein
MSYFESNPKTKARAVSIVQTALNRVTGTPFYRGRWDAETKSAFGTYARQGGTVENRGEVTYAVLQRLADETGTFTME